MKINIPAPPMVSESAREKPTKAPEWWQRKSKNQQQAYLKRHPGSYLKEFVKTSDKVRTKAPEPQKKPKAKVVRQQPVKTKAVEAPRIDRKAAKGPGAVKRVAKAIAQKIFRSEEQKRADAKLPSVKSRISDGVRKLSDNLGSLANTYKEQLSPANVKSLASFMNSKQSGKTDENSEKGQKVANRVVLNAAQIVLGLAAAGAIASGAAPLAGALTAAFFGFKDYRKGLEGTKDEGATIDAPEEESEELASESNVKLSDHPVDVLVDEFALWIGNQDLDAIAEQVASFEALQEMQEEGYVPNESDYSDEELDTILAAGKEEDVILNAPEEEDEDEEEDNEDQMESQSSVRPRLTFRCKVRHQNPALRKIYDVVFNGRVIGGLRCEEDFANKHKRVWIPILFDGFNETAYHSGRVETEPYTLVKNGKVCLTNPIKSTFSECCGWVKHNVEKQYL